MLCEEYGYNWLDEYLTSREDKRYECNKSHSDPRQQLDTIEMARSKHIDSDSVDTSREGPAQVEDVVAEMERILIDPQVLTDLRHTDSNNIDSLDDKELLEFEEYEIMFKQQEREDSSTTPIDIRSLQTNNTSSTTQITVSDRLLCSANCGFDLIIAL